MLPPPPHDEINLPHSDVDNATAALLKTLGDTGEKMTDEECLQGFDLGLKLFQAGHKYEASCLMRPFAIYHHKHPTTTTIPREFVKEFYIYQRDVLTPWFEYLRARERNAS